MMQSIAHISKLLLTAGKSRSATQVFVSDISEQHEKKWGKLFGILEIDSRERENEDIMRSLIEAAEEFYYGPKEKDGSKTFSGKAERSQLSLNDAENIEARFEKMLQKLNLKTTEIIRNEDANLLPEKINAVIGVMKDRSLFFTHLGRIQVYLIHKKKNDQKKKKRKSSAHAITRNLFQSLPGVTNVCLVDFIPFANSSSASAGVCRNSQ